MESTKVSTGWKGQIPFSLPGYLFLHILPPQVKPEKAWDSEKTHTREAQLVTRRVTLVAYLVSESRFSLLKI
jgi:hypothetical protein